MATMRQVASAQVRKAAACATACSPEELTIRLRPSMEHQANRVYDVWAMGTHLIAKEFLKDDEPNAPLNEHRALQLVQPLDIAPRPVFYDLAVGPVVVYEFLEGTMWDRRAPSPTELVSLAEAWLRLNALPQEELWLARGQGRPWTEMVSRLGAPLEAYAAWVEVARPSRKAVARLCLRTQQRMLAAAAPLIGDDVPLRFCRSDPRFANVIARPSGQLGLVDWEDSGLRDPARETADLLTHANQEDLIAPVARQAFLERYRPSQDDAFERRLRGYLAVFPVFWLGLILRDGLARVQNGTIDGWLINGVPAEHRLQRYLARCQVWPDLEFDAALANLTDVKFF